MTSPKPALLQSMRSSIMCLPAAGQHAHSSPRACARRVPTVLCLPAALKGQGQSFSRLKAKHSKNKGKGLRAKHNKNGTSSSQGSVITGSMLRWELYVPFLLCFALSWIKIWSRILQNKAWSRLLTLTAEQTIDHLQCMSAQEKV